MEIECEERVGGSRYFRITADLSTFGLATRQGGPHPSGTTVTLLLHLPDDPSRPVHTQAEVVGQYNARGGMRLAFRQTAIEDLRRIHRFLASRSR